MEIVIYEPAYILPLLICTLALSCQSNKLPFAFRLVSGKVLHCFDEARAAGFTAEKGTLGDIWDTIIMIFDNTRLEL